MGGSRSDEHPRSDGVGNKSEMDGRWRSYKCSWRNGFGREPSIWSVSFSLYCHCHCQCHSVSIVIVIVSVIQSLLSLSLSVSFSLYCHCHCQCHSVSFIIVIVSVI